MMKSTFTISSVLVFAGCLQTRADMRQGEQRQVLQQQVSTLQKSNADVSSRFAELEEQIRFLNGRIEVLENRLEQSQSQTEMVRKNSVELIKNQDQKIQALQEELTRMEQEQSTLRNEMAAVAAKASSSSGSVESGKPPVTGVKNAYEAGEVLFAKKDFRQAILEFQKYREKFPKGKNFATATYKIVVSFQELGLKDEAQSFYEEVIAKFPKSEEARKSKTRLKKLK